MKSNESTRFLVLAASLMFIACPDASAGVSGAGNLPAQESVRASQPMRLIHHAPAPRWRDSDPLGNGVIGAMVPGGVHEETITLNDDSLWSGEPAKTPHDGSRHLASVGKVRDLIFAGKYEEAHRISGQLLGKYNQCFMPLGNLKLKFPWEKDVVFHDYTRVLDLDTACHTTTYSIDGVAYTREAFVSHPDRILTLVIRASKPNALSFEASLDSLLQHEVRRDAQDLLMSGRSPIHADPHYLGKRVTYDEKRGTRFFVRLRAKADGGTVSVEANRVVCRNCSSVTLRLSTATSYNGFDKSPSDNNIDTAALTQETLDTSMAHSDPALRRRHIADHQALFRRVTLNLGNTDLDKANIEKRIGSSYVADKDPHLANLFYQYGRYLLIASSRKGSQPANLQGIWSNAMNPAWSANWTVNCNAQFNYRGIADAALPELAEPYLRMIEEAAVDGRQVAKNWYGLDGWTFHHNIDLWRAAMPVDGSTLWATFPTGGTWCATQAYDIWRFTEDPAELRERIWPLIRGNSAFWTDNLFKDPDTGHLVSCPDIYFENSYQQPDGTRGHLCAGPVSSTLMIRQVFTDCLEIADRLNITDDPILEKIRRILTQMPTIDINENGEIVQWDGQPNWIDLAKDQTLVSWGAIYSDQISLQQTPELSKALERMFMTRNNGFNETGSWVSAFPACTFARTGNGDRALEVFEKLITNQTSMNMRFRPFWMIDGNLGVMSAQQELLVQSHDKHIVLLPALPEAWASEGSAHGLRTRGNVGFDFCWKDGKVTAWRAFSSNPRPIKVYINGGLIDVMPKKL